MIAQLRDVFGSGREPGPSRASPEALGWAWRQPGERRAAGSGMEAACGHERGRDMSAGAKRPGLARIAGFGLAAAGGLACLGFLAGFFAFVAAIDRAEPASVGPVDGIVALTGGSQRIGDAIDLLAAGHGRRLLISGVNERTSRDEIARLNPSQRHWIDCCVDLDYRARNTIGNAIETRRWMRQHRFASVAVVTSNYHMPRTLVEIEHALEKDEVVLPYPVIGDGFDIERWWAEPAAARLVAAEYVKFLAAWVRTRFESDPERSRFAVFVSGGKPVTMVGGALSRGAN